MNKLFIVGMKVKSSQYNRHNVELAPKYAQASRIEYTGYGNVVTQAEYVYSCREGWILPYE
jgi:hypothetical protein